MRYYLILILRKKKEVLYLQSNSPHSPDLPWKIPLEIKDLWHKVCSSGTHVDVVDLRKYLERKNIKSAVLDTNVVPEEFIRNKGEQVKKQRKKRKVSDKTNGSSELGQLLSQYIKFPGLQDPRVVVTETENGDQKKQSLFVHNIQANPEEFKLISELISIIGYWFYEDEYVVVLTEFLKQKYYRDSDLEEIMKLSKKQVSGVLAKLYCHMLISKRTCERGKGQIDVYDMDLDRFVNACNYKLERMKEVLIDDITELGKSMFQCTTCKIRYTALDLPSIYGSGLTSTCNKCTAPLTAIDNSERTEKDALLEKLKNQILLLKDILDKLTHSKTIAPGKAPIRKPIVRPLPKRASSTITKPVVIDTTEEDSKPKDDEIDFEFDTTPIIEFDTTPIYCSDDTNEIYLPIVYTKAELTDNYALRLAKEFLDDIAEFQKIVNALVYVYKITEHSLYLAWARGYSIEEILRLLNTFSRNPVPLQLQVFIRANVNSKYYKAAMTLRNGSYCVQSDDRIVLEELLQKYTIGELVPKITEITETTTEVNGIKNVSYHFPINGGASEKMKIACRNAGVSLIDEFDFANARTLSSININLKPSTKSRFYQEFAVSRLFWNGFKCHSGILVLPCGAGKTMIGIDVIAALKKPSIIFCQSILSVIQWREQLVRCTTIPESNISRFSSNHAKEWNPGADIVISTYNMFSGENKSSENTKMMMKKLKEREWGLVVLDEVHLVPADTFRTVTNQIRSHIKLGLTATMVREDDHIQDLSCLVGPKLYELDIFTLRMHKFIAPVDCTEVYCPMTDIFARAYDTAKSSEERKKLYSLNPNKIRVVVSLIHYHLSMKHKIMVFCDTLFCLDFYAEILKRPKMTGSTHQDDRVRILKTFRESEEGDCVLFSSVGDLSIDLPEAHVVIQVAIRHGGRMQEGQRIGRIQRPQEKKEKGYFYSLLSEKTKEADYAKNRRYFLRDQGYTINKIKDLEYQKHLTDETLHVVAENMQNRLVEVIQLEATTKEKKAMAQLTRVKRTRSQETEKGFKRNLKKLKSKHT